ncbi:DUF456 domain-containing protein [Paenibacillus albiflavus]|uniref:DUF456 domain-containing protein n=1 Tax=Paenibacillus albiflavus TaxID=2545760 RepID=A0A4R4ECF5_9BACL|nr:DUF456 domain-containing protein [Paenibacillus albiflavus]TCZ75851.1 DUF456 domain-containing protein [Paenibacillus albiflavus]
MAIFAWVLIILLFIIGMIGSVVPVLPGSFAIYAAYFVYGWLISFEPFGWWFWILQTLIVVILIVSDYVVSAMGVKKFGGSKASVWGSTIGLIIGPFVIPAFGLILGPFIGAVIGELIVGASFGNAVKAGIGSVLGFFASTAVKIVLQIIMIILFFIWVF